MCRFVSSSLMRGDQVFHSLTVMSFNKVTATTSAPTTPGRSASISVYLFNFILSDLGLKMCLLLPSVTPPCFCFSVRVCFVSNRLDLTFLLSFDMFYSIEDLFSKIKLFYGVLYTTATRSSCSNLFKETKTTKTRSRTSIFSSTTATVTKTLKPIQYDSIRFRPLKTI